MANRIQVKIQRVAGVAPTPLKEGEIGVNLGDTPPSVYIGNAANAPTKVGPVIVSAQAPVGPVEGTCWWEPTGNTLSLYSGGMWHSVGGIQTVTTPGGSPVANAGKVVALNAAGKIDPGFLTIPGGLSYRGQFDGTAATLPANPQPGDYVLNTGVGNPNAAWVGLPAGTALAQNELLVYDGAAWHNAGTNLAMDSFLPLAGWTMDDFAVVNFAVPAGAAPSAPPVRLDGKDVAKSALDNWTIGGGVVAAPALAPITAPAAPAVAGDACDIIFGGGPADKTYTVTLTYTTNAGAGQTQTVNVQPNDTADMVANRAVAAITGDIKATKTGPATVHIALGTATSLTAMAVAIA